MKKQNAISFYLQLIRFRKVFFIKVFVLLTILASAQGKFTGDADDLNRKMKLKKLPTMSVWDKNGNKHDLADYINKNQLNEGKPIMLATFGTFGNYSIDELNDVANSSIPDEYNVIVLCVGDMAAMTKRKITNEGYEKNWSKFMVAKMLWDDLKLFYKEAWPFSVFADKDRNILYYSDGWIKPVKEVKLLLDQIQAKKMVYGKCWYTKKGGIAGKDDADAYYYVEVKAEGNKIMEKQGTKTKTLSETNYIYKDNVYYYDGIVKSSTDEGQETFTGQFKEGVPVTTVKGWHNNGKIRLNMPLNGTAKAFDSEGQLSMEGLMQNGLGNGNFSNYEKGVKTAEYSYKEGKLEGLVKEFKNGELVKEYLIMPQYEDYRELKNGLQAVKIKKLWGYVDRNGKEVIAPQYESTLYDFEEGVASVKLNGNWIDIDQKGKKITDEEGKKIKKNWKYDVKVYKTKPEILKFLKENFIANLYNEKFKNDTRVESLDPILKIDIPMVAVDFDIPYSNIAGIQVKKGESRWYIQLIGKIDQPDETFQRTEENIVLEYSVKAPLAYQIKENLRQLAILNGGRMIAEEISQLSQSVLFDILDKAVKAGKGYKESSSTRIVDASFSKSKYVYGYEYSGNKNTITYTGLEWDKFSTAYYEKEKGSELTKISIAFYESLNINADYEKGSDTKTSSIRIYVPDDQVLKVIAAIYRIEELNKE